MFSEQSLFDEGVGMGFFATIVNCLPAVAIVAMSMSFPTASSAETYDIVVYGGNSGGVMAAVQAARMGKTVALIEPGNHLGGMTSGGLGWVDVGDPKTIGGLGREYFHKVWAHYQDDVNWKWEKKRMMPGQHPPLPDNEQTMWIVEPSVAERIFDQMAAEAKVVVIRKERLDRKSGVKKTGQKIVSITMESGRMFEASMFIDATYEGDLMAAAGVSYVVGRDGNSRYSETINGIPWAWGPTTWTHTPSNSSSRPRASYAAKAACLSISPDRLRLVIARSCPNAANARILSCPSVLRRHMRPTAPSGWSPSLWCLANPPPLPRASRLTGRSACKNFPIPRCAKSFSRTNRCWISSRKSRHGDPACVHEEPMTILVLPSQFTSDSITLSKAAARKGWEVCRFPSWR